ncbi:MAG: Flp family type IVb pilin [Beijerinckiaceae bacterium]|jgi:pilus assembly protein Flp/PilA|nr:Flp family type IVb pilin [Beijerinckiaceae bacterium]
MKRILTAFWHDEDGATAIEYSLIAALIFAAILAAWPAFYDGFMTSWTNAGSVIKNAVQ